MSAHAELAAVIVERVPASWHVIDHERASDEPDASRPATVTIKLDSVRRLPAAPISGTLEVTWTVTIATPHVDPERADPAVFDELVVLLHALDAVSWLAWTDARKVETAGRYGFDVTLTTHYTPEVS